MIFFKTEQGYNRIFWILLIVSIAPVWLFPNFLTADGPCHVYNSNILKHWWQGDTGYYGNFYELNNTAAPNWFSHILLTGLQFMVPPPISDKIVITLCIILFTTGFRHFVVNFSSGQSYLSLWIFAFVWQMAMFMGFYNYMFSIGTYFWLSGIWLQNRLQLSWRLSFVLSVACLGLYFMHLLGLFLLYATIWLFILADLLAANKDGLKRAKTQTLHALMIILPSMLLAGYYISQDTNNSYDTNRDSFSHLFWKLSHLFSIQSITRFDTNLSKATSYFLLAAGIFAFVLLLKNKQKNKEWTVPLFLTIAIVLTYFLAYENMLGGSYIQPRLEVLSFIFLLLFVASVPMPGFFRIASVILSVVVSLVFTGNRLPAYSEINDIVTEFKSLNPYIKNKSVILPLKYELFPKGKNGRTLVERVLLFSHVAETIGTEKQLIFCDNYEGDTPYFPIKWKKSINPFTHLAKGAGIEAVPPEANLVTYNRNIVPVDYIILWGRNEEIEQEQATQVMDNTIQAHYELAYITPVYKIELYRLKNKTY